VVGLPNLTPRFGYYTISLGTVLQFLGLSGEAWSDSGGNGVLSLSQPGDVMLIAGMAITVLGLLLGFMSLAGTLPNERHRSPRLLPALPLVLLVGLSIGSVAFAFQTSDHGSTSAVASEVAGETEPTPFVLGTPGPNDCIAGTQWHPVMGHCMTPEAIAALENAQCQDGYVLDPGLLTCFPVSVSGEPGSNPLDPAAPNATPVCPIGYFWHPVMVHCMETATVSCPVGYVWNTALLSCVTTAPNGSVSTPPPNQTPQCPPDSFWHPVMVHCMSTVCPPGFAFDFTYETCLQTGPLPTQTPTPQPSTPTPPPGENCPDGYYWNPAKGHCDSTACPDGLVFDWDLLYCVIPPPTPTPTPSCPEGFFWHPAMGHCMNEECPPGLVFDPVTLFCVFPGEEQTPTETPVPPTETPVPPTPTSSPPPVTPTPPPGESCPPGYFWNPNKGHCDSAQCPPGFVFDWVLLYCIPAPPEPTAPPTETPPPPTPEPTDVPTPTPSCPEGFFWHPAMGHCMSDECPPGLVFDPATLFCVFPPGAGSPLQRVK
jgi:hypothetical protein